MDKIALSIDNYLSDIRPEYEDAVMQLHRLLTEQGCTVKFQEAKSGLVVSYNHPKTKKVVANFVSRKTGPVIRIYGDNAGTYKDYLQTMPEELEKLVSKAPNCKRMLDPTKCNSRCSMGYDITIHTIRHQKCKFNCFMFPIAYDHLPYLQGFLEHELIGRSS